MTLPHLFRSRLVIISAVLLAAVMLIFTYSSSTHVLRGSLTDDRVLTLADTDHNGTLSIREMRKSITNMIRSVAMHDLTYDLDSSGTTDRSDLRLLIQSIRSFLSAPPSSSSSSSSSIAGSEPVCLLSGLNAYSKFDESSGTYQYVSSARNSFFYINRSFSIAEWVKLGDLGGTASTYLSYAKGTSSLGYAWYLARNSTGFFSGIGQRCPNCSSVFAKSFGSIKTGQWYFVVTTFDQHTNKISISVNGRAPDTTAESVGFSVRDVTNTMGSTFGLITTEKDSLGDSLGKTGLWERVLSPAEISALYHEGLGLEFGQFQSCPVAACGDGILQAYTGEQCDDGNTIDNDGCTGECSITTCGDGVKQSSEYCDDGNQINDDACSNRCQQPFCGDGILQVSNNEECDDRNSIETDDCTNKCKKPVCGDRIVWSGHEQCDADATGYWGFCNSNCTKSVCGNGIKEDSEQCDDGNQVNNDACTNACATPICGDHIVQAGEQCDEGSSTDTVTCSNRCRIPVCGNGFLERAREKCDDGNVADGDGCNHACSLEPSYTCTEEKPNRCFLCGNGIVDPVEDCDDGNTVDSDVCSNTCRRNPACGDGLREGTEKCDDGNVTNGDGCSAACAIEDPAHTADLSVTLGRVGSAEGETFGITVYNGGPANATYTISMPVPSTWTLGSNSNPGLSLQNGVFTYSDTQSRLPGQGISLQVNFDTHGTSCNLDDGGPGMQATVKPAPGLYDPYLKNNTSDPFFAC